MFPFFLSGAWIHKTGKNGAGAVIAVRLGTDQEKGEWGRGWEAIGASFSCRVDGDLVAGAMTYELIGQARMCPHGSLTNFSNKNSAHHYIFKCKGEY